MIKNIVLKSDKISNKLVFVEDNFYYIEENEYKYSKKQAYIYLISLNRLFCLHSFSNIFHLKVNFSNIFYLIHRSNKEKENRSSLKRMKIRNLLNN